MTNIIYQDGFNTNFGADGRVPICTGFVDEDGCCAVDLCDIDPCALICSFIQLLPAGPMWDYHKAVALDYYNQSGTKPCEPACPPDFPCPSIVQHSVYTALRLYDLLANVLDPALKEADPFTAVTTLDVWLRVYGWEDCYAGVCRDLNRYPVISTEILGQAGPIACDFTAAGDECLTTAVKYGLVHALARADMFIPKTLEAINWVLEPLGAVVGVDGEPTAECGCCDMNFTLSAIKPTLPCPTIRCDEEPREIDAWYEPECTNTLTAADFAPICPPACACQNVLTQEREDYIAAMVARRNQQAGRIAGLPNTIWPGLITAECLFRSLIMTTNYSLRITGC